MPDSAALRRAAFERNGVRLSYHLVGEGPPVVMLHSATSSGWHEWGWLAVSLAHAHSCVLPDLRSHGGSEHVEGGLGMDEVVEDVLALIDKEQLGRPHVVGFSFGAEVALELELRRPRTAASLVLVSAATGHPDGVPEARHSARSWPRALRELHAETHGAEHWRTILDALTADAAVRGRIPEDRLRTLACPVLLITGAKDQAIRVEQAKRFAELAPRARLVLVDDVGHAVHRADPDLVSQEIAAFLVDDQGPTAASGRPA